MGGVNGDTASLFLGGLVNLRVVRELGTTLSSKDFGDSRCEGSFTVVDVACARCLGMYTTTNVQK